MKRVDINDRRHDDDDDDYGVIIALDNCAGNNRKRLYLGHHCGPGDGCICDKAKCAVRQVSGFVKHLNM